MHTKPDPLSQQKKARPAKRRVFLVDDHPMTREGLAAIINRQPDLEVAGDAGDAGAAMADLPHAKPDLIVTDLTMPNGSGMELIKNVHAILPAMPVLVLSMHDELLYAERALHAGARGYLMKDAGAEKVLEAIRHILDGQVYVSPQMNQRLLDGVAGPAPGASPIGRLSPREFEVFQMIGSGLITKEVAAQLHLSHKTVEAHRANTGVTTFNSAGNTLSGTVASTNGVTLASGAALANNGALTGTLAIGNGTLTGTGGSVSGATTLNGGTIHLTTGTLGALTLNATSTIDFGNIASGNNILTLGAVSSWTPGQILNIWNWSGTPRTAGGTDQLLVSSTSSWGANLGSINFYSDSGSSLIGGGGAMFVGGELVAVPEPSTWAAALALLAGCTVLGLRRASLLSKRS